MSRPSEPARFPFGRQAATLHAVSTSTLGGLVLGLPATAAALSDLPARVSTWKGVLNNVNHLSDERSRVLVSYPPRSTTTGGRLAGNKSGDVDTWVRVYSFGPFALLVGPRGVPYPIRARVGGRAAVVADSCILRIGVCPEGGAAGIMDAATAGASVIETAAFTDVTNAWRAPASADQLLVPGAEFASSPLSVYNAVSSASPATVAAMMATIEVWSMCDAANGVYCTQAYAAEYVGIVP